MLCWTPPSNNSEQAARYVLSAAFYLHATFSEEVWLWRGQGNSRFGVEPGMHTRAQASQRKFVGREVVRGTEHLLQIAREARIDARDDIRLPDLALLATLQHHGAATPLLDVTTDPLIALWMVAFASADAPDALDGTAGRLFGILRPPSERWIEGLDSRPYAEISDFTSSSYYWYRPPDVTERLRTQRGSFILGGYRDGLSSSDTTLHLDVGPTLANGSKNFIQKRLEKRGQRGNNAQRQSEVFAIHIRGSVKVHLRKLLAERSGLTTAAVYPTPWHQPFVEQFARTYGRTRPLRLDVPPEKKASIPIPTSPSVYSSTGEQRVAALLRRLGSEVLPGPEA